MVGLEVTPLTPSSRSRASSPDVMSWRRMLSSHSDWPMRFSSLIGAGTRAAISLLPGDELRGGRDDVPRGDAGGVHELFRLARRRQALHREVGDAQAVFGRKCLEHGGAETTLRGVVFDADELSSGAPSRLCHR